ncbi:MAG: cob(I)yrinic acid a,c-diamide adenosyltransferase [Deltaproteobacteria bacterium]|nr:cob(I)yrinic acid a,c-diamide adenosyltransferase [Deltaproteobacteria bacterium]
MKFSKRGDQGETSLLGGQRVPKYDLRPETYGTLDEASSALGVARALSTDQKMKELILEIQKDLLTLGAEIATLPEERERSSFTITDGHVERLEIRIDELQKFFEIKPEFVYPGETVLSAQIDVARTVIRRAERWAARLREEKLISNDNVNRYLNRLADLLFTLARYEEAAASRIF